MRISWLICGVAALAFIGTFGLAHYRASYQAQVERTVASKLRDPGSAKFSGVRMIKHRGLEVACGYGQPRMALANTPKKRSSLPSVRSIRSASVSLAAISASALARSLSISVPTSLWMANGVRTIIVETANRFARDLMVQEVGYARLRERGINLIAADSPNAFQDETPTAKLVRQVLGAIAEFDKAMTVAKLRGARDRKRKAARQVRGAQVSRRDASGRGA